MSSQLMPIFSVIIPTANRNSELSICLEKISPSSQSLASSEYEVLVTDDGSTAIELKEIFSWAHFISGPKIGPAANRNYGAKHARGAWLVFIDDDCIPDRNLLLAFKAKIKESEVLEGCVLKERERRSLSEAAPINETGGFLWSCNMAVSKPMFDKLGGFSEKFPYAAMEDIEFRIRLSKADITPLFVKDAKVIHPWKEHPGAKYCRAHKESTFVLLKLHPEERKKLTPLYYFRAFLRGVIFSTLPGLLRYRFRGLKSALYLHWYNLDMALTLLFRRV